VLEEDPRAGAAVDLLARTGATEVTLRNLEAGDGWPALWLVRGMWPAGWALAADLEPVYALERLCEAAVDGGTCTGCGRPSGVIAGSLGRVGVPEAAGVCWYRFDADSDPPRYLRGCESPDYVPSSG
jgi:hypothetical protein